MFRVQPFFFLLTAFTYFTLTANGQDPQAAGMEPLKIWYNPALKTDKTPFAHALIRNVKYPGILSWSAKTATLELVFINADKDADDNLPYLSISAGINANSASDRFINSSSALLGLSYALPLNYNNTYIAIGVQGNYSFNRVGNTGYTPSLPDKFDQTGAVGWSLNRDPFATGYNYGYFTLGAGTAVFHTNRDEHWYIGVSARYINHPYTEWSHNSALATAYGLQGGYGTTVAENAHISLSTNLSFQRNDTVTVLQQYYGIDYIRSFRINDSVSNTVSAGIGINPRESIKPNIGIGFGRNHFGFYYELNLPHIASGGYNRQGWMLFYRREL